MKTGNLTRHFPVLAFATFGLHGLIPESVAQTQNPLQVTILYGDRSHGSGAHEFKAGSVLLATCFEQHQTAIPAEVTTHRNWPTGKLEILDQADAIIFYTDATKIVAQGWETIDSFASKGKGIMFMHYAVHPSEQQGEQYFKRWVGWLLLGWKIGQPVLEGEDQSSYWLPCSTRS